MITITGTETLERKRSQAFPSITQELGRLMELVMRKDPPTPPLPKQAPRLADINQCEGLAHALARETATAIVFKHALVGDDGFTLDHITSQQTPEALRVRMAVSYLQLRRKVDDMPSVITKLCVKKAVPK